MEALDFDVLHDAISAAVSPLIVLDRLVHQSCELVPHADGASLEVLRDKDTLEYVNTAGTLTEFFGLRIPVNNSLSGLALRTGQIQRSDDTLTDPRVNAAAITSTGIRSMICVPLSGKTGSVAVLKLSSQQAHAFTSDDVTQLRSLAHFMSEIITAAGTVAAATAATLTQFPAASTGHSTLAAARFIANLVSPGLADETHTRHLITYTLAHNDFTIVYQPIINLTTGIVTAYEALSRFPEPPSTTPDWWFTAARAVNLDVPLELATARAALTALPDMPDTRLALNFGARTILHHDFPTLFTDVPLDRIIIELTEHESVENYRELLTVLAPFRNQGALFSVDDTGSGASGLNHILTLNPDEIKLDRHLVTGIDHDPVKYALASALASFASTLNAAIVAEGVETDNELDTLTELHVTHAQGYLFGHPAPLPPTP